MISAARWGVVALLTVHGLIHLLGAAKGLGWAAVEQLKEPISTALGVAWLAAAALVLTAAVMVAARAPSWWWAVAAVAAFASQAVILTSWSDAKAGTVANLVLLAAAVLGFAASGPGSFRAQWELRADEALAAAPPAAPAFVTEADLASLPAPLRAYLRRSRVVGTPRVTSFAATVHGRIRSGPDTAWMPFTGRQLNTFGPHPQRLFYLDAVRGGLPVTVFHDYHDATATMRGKILGLIPILDASGPVMDQGETVTVFNDMVVFAPAALLDAPVTWIGLNEHRVRGEFTNGAQTVTAELVFDAAGDLVRFISNDRARASADGKSFTTLPWDTPISGYRDVGGRRVAVAGDGRWDAPPPDGHFTYIEFHVDDLTYNPAAGTAPLKTALSAAA